MVVGRIYGVVGLTGFSDKKMSGLLLGPQKRGRDNGVVVLTGWSYGGVPLYILFLFFFPKTLRQDPVLTPTMNSSIFIKRFLQQP